MPQVRANPEEVRAIRQQIAAGVGAGGLIAPHMGEVHQLQPEIAAFDLMEFRGEISAAGVVTDPEKQSTTANYWSELYAISGWREDPATDKSLPALANFQVTNQGRGSETLFTTPVYFANLIHPEGGLQKIQIPRGLYVFGPNETIKVEFDVDGDGTNGYAAAANAHAYWSVLLHFNLWAVQR